MKLVFVENNRPVTDSLTVAETFGKEHRRVMQDIRELGCSEEFRVHHFVHTPYIHPQNGQTYEKVFMTQQGFAFLAFGYTGQDADAFKEKYINEFETMRSTLENKIEIMSERKALIQSLKLTVELAEEVEEVKEITANNAQKIMDLETKIDEQNAKIDEQITLDSGEQRKVQKAVAKKVYATEPDKSKRDPLFRQIYREIKDRWAVPSYKDVRKHELDGLIGYIEAWRPIAS